MALVISIYAIIGVVFSVYFLVAGYQKIDGSAQNAGFSVRLLWMPAALALWPVLVAKVLRGNGK